VGVVGILALAGLVLVPLVREYADFRRSRGLGRGSAALTTLLVVPSVGVGVAVALPVQGWPYAQWGVTVAAALAVYSLAVRAVWGTVEPERASASR
jgi:hypothetical protein